MRQYEEEDGMGFGGLAESREERREREQLEDARSKLKVEEKKVESFERILGERLGPRLAIGSSIEEAIGSLPDEYSIDISIIHGHVNVSLWYPEGDSVQIRSNSDLLSDAIRDALLRALEQQS